MDLGVYALVVWYTWSQVRIFYKVVRTTGSVMPYFKVSSLRRPVAAIPHAAT